MPQIIGLVLVGASLYAGLQLVVKNIRQVLAAAERSDAETQREAPAAPRDEGPLEWDEAAGVYRPARRA
jgi:hypothetical protein